MFGVFILFVDQRIQQNCTYKAHAWCVNSLEIRQKCYTTIVVAALRAQRLRLVFGVVWPFQPVRFCVRSQLNSDAVHERRA